MKKYFREKLHLIRLHKSDKQKDKEIKTLVTLWENFSKKGDTRFDKLINVCLYSSLVNRDLYYLAEDYYFQKNKNRKNFLGRLFCMTIIEFLDGINYLLGKELTDELEQNNMLNYTPYIKNLNKHYSNIKRKYERDFRTIRNHVAAHRSKDAKLLMEYIDKVPIDKITAIGQEISKGEVYFDKITTLMFVYLTDHKIDETRQQKIYNLVPGAVNGGKWEELFSTLENPNIFNAPPNTAVFTTKYIIENNKTITYVSHEEDDGAWQFFGDKEVENIMEDSRVVSLGDIVMLDPTILDLWNMSAGSVATRKDKNDNWSIKRQKE